jgi:hypothetical protein
MGFGLAGNPVEITRRNAKKSELRNKYFSEKEENKWGRFLK